MNRQWFERHRCKMRGCRLKSILCAFLSCVMLAVVSLADQPASETPATTTTDLRILQFNLWQEGTSVPGGFDRIVDVIIAYQADVVAMSEVRNYKQQDLHRRLIAALADRGHTFYGQYVGGDAGVLSRLPLTKAEMVTDSTAITSGSVVADFG